MRIHLAPPQLIGRAALLIIGIALVQFVATILLYSLISRDSVREDHARRVAELLVVSQRLQEAGGIDVPSTMTTKHLQVWITPAPAVDRDTENPRIRQMEDQIEAWEPSLALSPLNLDIERSRGRDHFVGSVKMDDGRWLNFRSANLSTSWAIIATASLITVLLTASCIFFAIYVLRQMGAPLRRLTEATRQVGEAKRVTLAEEGPTDLRNLSRAFNEMQDRIAQTVDDQTKAFVAISHDLRTPLARLRLASDFVEPAEMRTLVDDNAAEMEAMIASLQTFLQVQQMADDAKQVDINELLHAAAADKPGIAVKPLPDATVTTYPDVLRRALEPLVDNALQYGEQAEISAEQEGGGLRIHIRDQGPGIADEHLPALIEPFFRVDAARARNTPGFGLGIPTAHRLLQRFGGALHFRNRPAGGFHVIVDVPVLPGAPLPQA